MTPDFDNGQSQIYLGDCLTTLGQLPEKSVNCVVTSPPYYGLRDYGHPDQIGLEATPEAFVSKMVEVFRQCHRVLADDGTLWLNLGDSYANSSSAGDKVFGNPEFNANRPSRAATATPAKTIPNGLKPKDLVGIPWRVAFALQADGWYLRQDIIWAKPNPMPESVTDRCTKAHEYIFLLSKSARYYFGAEEIKEEAVTAGCPAGFAGYSLRASAMGVKPSGNEKPEKRGTVFNKESRNRRSVWSVATQPYSGAHFATFPPKLIEPCILAGCPEGGTVLDPFAGSGTTLLVAQENRRRGIGCELNPDYLKLAAKRLGQLTIWALDKSKMAAPMEEVL